LEKLKNVAIEVSEKDYSYHIENLNFQISRGNNFDSSNTDMAQNDSLIHTKVKELEKLCKVLGIPIVSSAKELNSDSIVIFASQHDRYNTEPKEIKDILLQKLNSCDKKTILGLEFYSDKFFVDLFNDPTKNLNDDHFNKFISLMNYEKTVRGLVEAFNEIQQKYSRDRFEIKPFDVTLERLEDAIRGDGEKEKEYDEKRDAQIVKNILDLLKTYGDDNLVFYTGRFHVIDMLTKLKEIIESGNKEGIKINNIIVFLPRHHINLSFLLR